MPKRFMPNRLRPYRVTLNEDPDDSFAIFFDCMADDMDHAVEQAENAYPGCRIVCTKEKQ